jgi:hypothetical protein
VDGRATSTSFLVSPAITTRQTPTAISQNHGFQDPTFTLHSNFSGCEHSLSACSAAVSLKHSPTKLGDGPIRRAYRAAVRFLKWIASFSPNTRAPQSGIDKTTLLSCRRIIVSSVWRIHWSSSSCNYVHHYQLDQLDYWTRSYHRSHRPSCLHN